MKISTWLYKELLRYCLIDPANTEMEILDRITEAGNFDADKYTHRASAYLTKRQYDVIEICKMLRMIRKKNGR